MTQYTEGVPSHSLPTSELSLVEAEYHAEEVEAKSAMLPGLQAPGSEEDTLSQEKEDSSLLTTLQGRNIRYERLKMDDLVSKKSKFSLRYYFGCPLSVLALFALGLVWSTTVYYYWQDSVDDCQDRAEDEIASSTMAASAFLDGSSAEVKSEFDTQMKTLSDAIVILKDQTMAEFEQISISAGFCAESPSQEQSCAQQADFVVTCYSTTSTSVEVKEVIRSYQASICERAKASTTSFDQLNDLIRGFQVKNAQVNAKQRESFQAFGTEQVQLSYDGISESSDTSDENIIHSAVLSGGVGVALVVVCLWASMFLSKALTMPLQAISADMEAVADFTFNDVSQLRASHVTEVYNLGTKYTYLKAALLTFSKFIPKTVIKQVVKGDDRMLGPYLEKKEVSILMADLANFTNISEQIGLSSTMSLMLDFLSAMETVVESSGGVIGDFSGNGITAFWGVPDALEDHAKCAVECSQQIKAQIKALNKKWVLDGVPDVAIRIGINTGEVFCGNVGSTQKLKFGILGDEVSFALRLQNLNKRWNTQAVCSAATFQHVQSSYVGRPVETVIVKGRESTLVHEIFCRVGEETSQQKYLQKSFTEIFQLYKSRQFNEVLDLCLQVDARLVKPDPAAAIMAQNARHLLQNPPASDWNGGSLTAEKYG